MNTPVRHKKFSGRKKILCDYPGNCKNIGYAEVYFSKTKKEEKSRGGSYLCKKHFKQERKILENRLFYWVLPNKSQNFLKWSN